MANEKSTEDVGGLLYTEWAKFAPQTQVEAFMDYWVYEWIRRYYGLPTDKKMYSTVITEIEAKKRKEKIDRGLINNA